jgi:CheY-like chemotaxis protein
VQGIVEQSGGSIEVKSESGRGTAFRVSLPRASGDENQRSDASTGQDLRGHETILLVEDQREVRDYCSAALSSFGYRVLRADGAAAAIEICTREETAIDLVLSDVVMPELSGPELAGQLVAIRPGLKVLFMSGYAEKELAAHGVPEQGIALLQKPFEPPRLAARVREVLGKPAARSRVLVVDGEPAVRRLIRAVLERAGYEVAEARECGEALKSASDVPAEIVIVELTMTGSEAAVAVRTLRDELPRAAIVGIVDGMEETEMSQVRSAGAAALLSKPVAPGQLLTAVKRALAARLR